MAEAAAEFEAFAVARMPALYRSAWLLCGNRHQAEDLVQETLVKVFERMSRRIGRVDNPAAYAQTTLVRTYLNTRRRRSSGEQPYADLPETVASDEVTRTELRMLLEELLADLSPRDRAVVVLRYLEDLPVEQVADRLDLSPGAVRNRSMRALARMRTREGLHE